MVSICFGTRCSGASFFVKGVVMQCTVVQSVVTVQITVQVIVQSVVMLNFEVQSVVVQTAVV